MSYILVVDDSSVIRKVATRMLVVHNFITDQAENGQEALEICARAMPAGILLDWNMPVMDGLAFLRTLRMAPGGDQPKVIFCTAEGDMSRISEALSAGADEYIMKPFDEEVLISKLELVGLLPHGECVA